MMNQRQGQQQVFEWPNCTYVDINKFFYYRCQDHKSLLFVFHNNLDIFTVPIIYPFTEEETKAKLRKTLEVILSNTLLNEQIDSWRDFFQSNTGIYWQNK